MRLVASGKFKQISTILKNDGLIHSLHLMDTTEVIVNENVSSDPLVVTINRLQKLMKNLGHALFRGEVYKKADKGILYNF